MLKPANRVRSKFRAGYDATRWVTSFLEGLSHEMYIFLMAYKVTSVLPVYARVVFKILFVFIAKKIKCFYANVFTCFLWKHLLIFWNPSSNPFQRACCAAFRNLPVTVKLAPESGCDSKNCSVNRPWHVYLGRRLFPCPIRGDHVRKLTNDRDRKAEKNFDLAYGTSFRIRKCFHRSNQNLYI
jgi:hypothetical protein